VAHLGRETARVRRNIVKGLLLAVPQLLEVTWPSLGRVVALTLLVPCALVVLFGIIAATTKLSALLVA